MGISLEKRVETAKVSLKKVGFSEKVRVILALDVSGSMSDMFRSGVVDNLVERLLAIGINMDTHEDIEVYAYHHEAFRIGNVTRDNIDGYVAQNIRKYVGGGTEFLPIMEMISLDVSSETETIQQEVKSKNLFKRMIGKKDIALVEVPKEEVPTVVFFVTDGENSDVYGTKALIAELAHRPIFWQFIGIDQSGWSTFKFLETLDDMSGRIVDNANFFNAGDIDSIDDKELYDRILGELPDWYAEASAKHII